MLQKSKKCTSPRSYIVLFRCPESHIKTGQKEFFLDEGVYGYLGSCGTSCDNRVSRHMIRDFRKRHWHVDYLPCIPFASLIIEIDERKMSRYLSDIPSIPGFGNSDDRGHPRLFMVVDIPCFLNRVISFSSQVE